MPFLVAGLLLFLGTHVLTMRRSLRADLIGRFGANGYKGLYSAASIAGFVLLVYGYGSYRADGYIDIWMPAKALTHVAYLLLLPVFVLLAAQRPSWIKTKVRHPMLLAIKCWALAHLLVNGDLGSMLLFGGFLAWAVASRVSLRERERVEGSTLQPTAFGKSDVLALAVGIGAYVVFALWLHPILIGVPVFG
jgi:uncharacterized membrane protein